MTRNPEYLSYTSISIAAFLFSGNILCLACGLIGAVLGHYAVIEKEIYLSAKFKEWEIYKADVPIYF
jgi:protein-S-isoprenylcysteine O-methyltransferase Ste14